MAYRRSRNTQIDYWPSFVDVLSTLLLVFVFLLSIFGVIQFFLSREISGRDTLLDQLRSQIDDLANTLTMERTDNTDLTAQLAALQTNLATAEADRDRLQGVVDTQAATTNNAAAQLTDQRVLSQQAMSQVQILNQQIAALRAQLAAVQDALGIAQTNDTANEATIADLGNRLNLALQQRVEELATYRSDFFGRLREILGNRDDIQIVGDRFVFQSEVLFATGSADLNPAGRQQIITLAGAIQQLETEIPADIPWVLQVNGHTDDQPIRGGDYADNWELSTARALSVVELLQQEGVSPNRLAAAGFGEYQPIETGDTPEARAANRRIELKLTE